MKTCCHLLLSACLLSASALHAETYIARVGSVPDGDTLWVHPKDGGPGRKLRLLGIDAPEICQASGQASREALRATVQGRWVQVTVTIQDSYQRGLARLELGGMDVAAQMVQTGHAWAARWHGAPTHYAAQEQAARAQGLGLFADASAQWPGDFRKQHGSCYPQRRR